MHVKAGTEDELLVVGVLFDVSEYGTNVEVRSHGRETLLVSPFFPKCLTRSELSYALARMYVVLAETRSARKKDSF